MLGQRNVKVPSPAVCSMLPLPHTMIAVLILAETNDFARSIIGARLPKQSR